MRRYAGSLSQIRRVVAQLRLPQGKVFADSPRWCTVVNTRKPRPDEQEKRKEQQESPKPPLGPCVHQFPTGYVRSARRSRQTEKGVIGVGCPRRRREILGRAASSDER